MNDRVKRLKRLIVNSKDSEILWEIPKGSKNKDETNIDCAIREFYEETSIDYSKYKIIHEIEPVCSTVHDDNIEYKTFYYLAK